MLCSGDTTGVCLIQIDSKENRPKDKATAMEIGGQYENIDNKPQYFGGDVQNYR